MNKTKISESQIAQFILQGLIFAIPFTSIEMTQAQMQAGAGLGAAIAVFCYRQRYKQKQVEKDAWYNLHGFHWTWGFQDSFGGFALFIVRE